MKLRRGILIALAVLATAALLATCGGDDRSTYPDVSEESNATAGSGRTLAVPEEFETIQAAVDASRPGDLILIAPGTYEESVVVDDQHPNIVIRGKDRNKVVLDGDNRLVDGIKVTAPGVAVENLTVHSYMVNGVVWSSEGSYADEGRQLEGWRGSYLTVYNNGLYGVYAFGASHGRFDHIYASGHPDSGIYIGRCKPCNALVTDSTVERNHVGIELTNASGNVVVRGNLARRNRVGIQVNSLVKERGAPQVETTIEGNDVAFNQEKMAPRASDGFGAGIVINGGRENTVRDNDVRGHKAVGILVLDSSDFTAQDNRVESNRLRGNALDIALETRGGSAGNCFLKNRATSALPKNLQEVTVCGESVSIGATRVPTLSPPPQIDYRAVRPPSRQPNMKGAGSAAADPADGTPESEG